MIMVAFVVVMALVGWVVAIMALVLQALEADGTRKGWVFGFLAAILFSFGCAVLIEAVSGDEPNVLCLSGHQEWASVTTGPVMVGKTMMPATTSHHKQWVCDQWESER